MRELASDVEALLDDLRIESAAVVGLSVGGLVAMELAIADPRRWWALGLVAATAEPVTDAAPAQPRESDVFNHELLSFPSCGRRGSRLNRISENAPRDRAGSPRLGLMHGANVESKTSGADLQVVARRAAALGAWCEGTLEQVDTYFRVAQGRLKLREISHRTSDGAVLRSAELIRYERPDEGGARESRYEREEVGDVESCRTRLEAECGVRGLVLKRRDLWMLDSTRIHLDQVEGLGDFVELETVSSGTPGPADRLEHDRLFAALGLDAQSTVEVSYIDLLEPTASVPCDETDRSHKAER